MTDQPTERVASELVPFGYLYTKQGWLSEFRHKQIQKPNRLARTYTETPLYTAAQLQSELQAQQAAIVAWLRGPSVPDHSDEGGCPFDKAAAAIERGEHKEQSA